MTPKKGGATPTPQGRAPTSPTIGTTSRPADERLANPQDAEKAVPRKIGGAPTLTRKRAYIGPDE